MSAESLEGFSESDERVRTAEGYILGVEERERIKDGSVDRCLRIILAISLVLTVCLINIAVFCLINKTIDVEVSLVSDGTIKASERIIDRDVFLALIAAVVAEITPVLVVVVRNLFSGSK